MKYKNEIFDPNVDYVGTILWFRDDRGFGFIECDAFRNEEGEAKGIFAHYSRIMTDENWKTLAKGQLVKFQVVMTTKGLMAVNIREQKVPHLKATIINDPAYGSVIVAGETYASQGGG